MNTTTPMTKALDGARILWRWFIASDDKRATEGHVREFTKEGDYVRVAETCYKDDDGEWLRVSDIRVVGVLEEHVQTKARPVRRERIEGDEWKDGDGVGGGR